MSSNPNHPPLDLTPADYEARHRFPRGGWWTEALQPRPDLARGSVNVRPLMGPGVAPPPPPYHLLAPATYYREELARAEPPKSIPQALPQVPPPAPPAPPVARTQSTVRTEQQVTHLDYSVPKNTAVVGGIVTRTNLRLPCDIKFADFWDRVCARMDLDPAEAELGYRFSSDRAGDPPRSLATEQDLVMAIENGQGLVRRARTRKVEVMIFNLKQANQSNANSKKRKEPASAVTELPATADFTEELRQLKEHLACATHTGRWCHVSPIDGHHKQLDIFVLTLWAKKIFLKEATLTQPPNLLQFDHGTKRRRTSPARVAGPSSTAVPAIHLHLNEIPLTNQGGQRCLNIPSHHNPHVSDDSEDGQLLIQYPSIEVLLRDLHQVMPAANLLQYRAAFVGHGVFYVDGVKDISDDFLLAEIGMPFGVLKRFRRHAMRLIRRAEKQKAITDPIDVVALVQEMAQQEQENVE